MDGEVRVSRGAAGPVALAPGGAAFVRGEPVQVKVEAAPARPAPLATLDFPGALGLAFADGGEVWAASAKQWVRWQPEAGTSTRKLFLGGAANDGVTAVFAANLSTLLAVSGEDRADGVAVRDLPAGGVKRTFPVRVSEPRFLAAAPDLSWIATTDPKPGNRVRVWDAATAAERFARDLDLRPYCTAATPDGKYLVAEATDLRLGTDNRVLFLDAATGEEVFTLPTRRRQVTALAFSPDGRTMAAGFNGVLQLWDVPKRELVRTLDGFERVVTRLVVSPAGDLVAAGTQDGQVWVWATASGKRIQVIDTGTRGVRALAFSPDGKRLASATNKGPVALWLLAADAAPGA